jgi:hypothetical protein
LLASGWQKMKRPSDKTAPPNEKPPAAPKPSRMDEILKVIEEYANTQRQLLRTLRKKFFH